ncbi:hypothetical protein ACFVH6_00265 [Spirillospora sp. NPDC127200]
MGRSVVIGTSLTAAAGLVLLTGCGDGGDEGGARVGPSATASATRPATPPGRVVTWQGMKLTLPAGWKLNGASDPAFLCVQPPGQDRCGKPKERSGALQVSRVGGRYSSWPGDGRMNEKWGWSPGDPPFCMAAGSTDADLADQQKAEIAVRGLTPLADGRRAEHREWHVPCRNGKRFVTKAWYLPESKVVFYILRDDPALAAAHQAIVKSADLRGFKRA